MVVGPKAEVMKTLINILEADILALATDFHTDKKCYPDTSKEKGKCFYKANGANVLDGELLAGIKIFVYLLVSEDRLDQK